MTTSGMYKYSEIVIFIFFLVSLPLKIYSIEIQNDFIKIFVDDNSGRFIFSTTGGDSATELDDNKLLLYAKGKKGIPTSYTTVRIANKNYIFGSAEGLYLSGPESSGNEILTVWAVEGIEINQRLAFAKGPNTGRLDNVLIEYTLTNTDEKAKIHSAGLRILLDTLLGNNDGVPFTVPGTGKLTTETEFKGKNIPDYLYVLEKIINPSVLSQCFFKLQNYPLPDKVVLMNWSRLYNNPWNAEVQTGRTFNVFLRTDSAIGIYWNPVILFPRQSIRFAVLYGVYGVTIESGNIFNVAVSAPTEIEPNEPFTISCDIENNSAANTFSEVDASLDLPANNSLICKTEDTVKFLGNLKPKATATTSWPMIAKLANDTYEINYSIIINGNIETLKESIPKSIEIPKKLAIKKLKLNLRDYGIDGINEALKKINIEIKNNLNSSDSIFNELSLLVPASLTQ